MGPESRYGDWYKLKFLPVYNEYVTAFSDYIDVDKRTPTVTDRLKRLEKELRPLTRTLYASLRGNILVLDEDYDAMGLPKKSDGERHPAPIATLPPAFTVTPLESNRLMVTFYPEGKRSKRGKPEGQHGAEVKWEYVDGVERTADEFGNSKFDTASPYVLEFTSKDAGKEIEMALRWENSRGEKGPWSHIYRVTIP
jgi:hypothetical protein